MKHWILGSILSVLAVILLYASGAAAVEASDLSWLLLTGFVLAVLGLFITISCYEFKDHAVVAALASQETDLHDPRPWAGGLKTLGILSVGLIGLLVYVGIYVGAHAGLMAWIVYPFVALAFLGLGGVMALTFSKEI